jgi:hypothetical protein
MIHRPTVVPHPEQLSDWTGTDFLAAIFLKSKAMFDFF